MGKRFRQVSLYIAALAALLSVVVGGVIFLGDNCCSDEACTDCLAGFCFRPLLGEQPVSAIMIASEYCHRNFNYTSINISFQSFVSGIDHPPESIS